MPRRIPRAELLGAPVHTAGACVGVADVSAGPAARLVGVAAIGAARERTGAA